MDRYTLKRRLAATMCAVFFASALPLTVFADDHVHDYGAWTYVDDDYHKRTCSICGDELTQEHDWVLDEENSFDPSDEEPGMYFYDCAICGGRSVEIIQAYDHPHYYDAVITEPTCTEGGYTTYTCPYCGDSFVGDEVGPLGHDYYQRDPVEPTCTESGSATFVCIRCGDSYLGTIDALGHAYVDVVTEPTCTAGGYTTRTCSRCGDVQTTDETSALGHDYVSVVTSPTCTEGGYTTYTCTRCGDTYTANPTNAFGHIYGAWRNDDNENHVRVCARCGKRLTQAHNWVLDEENSVDPTEDSEGVDYYDCPACGAHKEEVIPMLTPEERVPGDSDGDGKTDLQDVTVLTRYLAGGWGVTVDESNADVDGDGVLTLRDLTLLRRFLAGWDVVLA